MLFTKGAESAILPFTTSGEIEKTRLHVDEFALVRSRLYSCFYLNAFHLSESLLLLQVTLVLCFQNVLVSSQSKI